MYVGSIHLNVSEKVKAKVVKKSVIMIPQFAVMDLIIRGLLFRFFSIYI